jgi:hypothetical protein
LRDIGRENEGQKQRVIGLTCPVKRPPSIDAFLTFDHPARHGRSVIVTVEGFLDLAKEIRKNGIKAA